MIVICVTHELHTVSVLCYLLGIHPNVDASTDPEVEPAERWRQRSLSFIRSESLMCIYCICRLLSYVMIKLYGQAADCIYPPSSVSVICSHCPAEWLPALLWACLPTLCQPGPEDPRSGHGECAGPSNVYTNTFSYFIFELLHLYVLDPTPITARLNLDLL